MGWSAFLWTYLWVFFGLGALALGLVAFFVIRHFVKKHKAKKVTAGKQANVKVKGNEKAKEKAKRKELRAQKKADKKARKQAKQEQEKTKKEPKPKQEKAKKEQTVKPRQPKPTKEVQTEKVDKISKFALPRFDVKDAKIVEKDKAKFIDHQKLYIKQKKYSLTKDEQKQLEKINADFVRDYGHIPNQDIPADCTQKESGCYCFNGKESENFKKYCEQHPYDASKDNGDRVIVQFDLGSKFKKLLFCINPNDPDMVNAAMQDIDLKVSSLNANPTVSTVSVHDGKFKVNSPITYDQFCHKNKETEKNAGSQPDLEQ